MNIPIQIAQIQARIQQAAIEAGRVPTDIQLLLATKTVAPESIIQSFNAGVTLIGENKVKELKDKADALASHPHDAHFIGHLQSNKVKEVVRLASCIQSLDRLSLAEKLQRELEKQDRTISVMIQVNTSQEASKFGISSEALIPFAQQLQAFDRLQLSGLMTIGLFASEMAQVRPCFQLLKRGREELLQKGFDCPHLSMGMSHDLETAIEEGATIVRVGTAIFGKRIYPDQYYWNESTTIQ